MDQVERLTEIKKLEGALEAILFAAGHPVTYEKIAEALSLTPRDVRRMAEHLAENYNSDETGGIMMLLFPDTCQLCTREDYLPYVREALGIRRGGNLSASSLEVLAIVAYNQPVTRTFIDTVRGVDSAYAVGSLIDKELIAACGRLDAPGRPMLYGTTDKFLRVFGLNDLSELPEADSVLAAVDSLSQSDSEESENTDENLIEDESEKENELPDEEVSEEIPDDTFADSADNVTDGE
ncbi:MAG: SMC-Scp complex subunit ScpB [Clostridia bacterium]|nr:SMC-Scp complex subunit ScpB [Clostridia bacterium]